MKKLILFMLTSLLVGMVNLKAQNLNEGFEEAFVPTDWTMHSYGSNDEWAQNGFQAIQGSLSARITDPGFGTQSHDDWLITPKLTISSATDSIHFFLRTTDATSFQALNLKVSTTGKDTASFTQDLALNVEPAGNAWQRFSFGLDAFLGQDIYLAFQAFNNGDGNMFLDSIVGPEFYVPACSTVTYVNFTLPTHNSIEATWDSIPNGVQYDYSVFSLGDGPGGTPITTGSTSDTSIVINGLPMAADLEFWVTTDCGPVDSLSELDGPFTFNTICGPTEIEYHENFDNYLPFCWEERYGLISDSTVFTTGNVDWHQGTWLNDPLNSNGSDARTHFNRFWWWPSGVQGHWLISNSINLDSIDNSQLSFFTALTDNDESSEPSVDLDGDDRFKFVISLDDGITWADTNVLLEYDSITGFPSHLGEYIALPFGEYSGMVKFAFYIENEFGAPTFANGNALHIDEVKWSETPTCDIIPEINVDSLGVTFAEVSWDTTTFATSFLVEYDTTGFTLGTGMQVTVSSMDTFLYGLDPNTTYDVYVAPICSATDTGSFQLKNIFTTYCAPTENFFVEPFNTFLPSACWFESTGLFGAGPLNITGNSGWRADTYLNSGTNAGASLEAFFGTLSDGNWLISEAIDLDSLPGLAQVEFDAGVTTTWGSAPDFLGPNDTLHIAVSTDDGATWNPSDILYTITVDNQPSNSGEHYAFPITHFTGTVRIGFYFVGSSSGFAFHMDNFEISEAPTCLSTYNYTVISVEDTTASLSWSDHNSTTNYLVEYGPAGFTPGVGLGTTLSTTMASIDLIGLDPVTEYDFYVRALCSPTDTAAFFAFTSFTTECAIISETLLEEFTTYIPSCWYEAVGELGGPLPITTGPSQWGPDGYLNFGSIGSARIRIKGNDQYHWLISEPLFLGADPKQIEFDAGQTEPFNTSTTLFGIDDKFAVVISTDDGVTWEPINTLLEFNQEDALENTGAHYVASLIDFVNAGNIRIGFYGHSEITNLDINAYVDNFVFEDLDPNSLDLTAVGLISTPVFCVGDDEELQLIVENTGFVPVTSFSVKTNILGASPWTNNQSFFTNIPVGGKDTVVLRNLDNLLASNYTVECKIKPVGDVNALNNKTNGTFFISEYPNVFAGSDITICEGDSIKLEAVGAVNYTWNNGLPNGGFVKPTVQTAYVVEGTNISNCSSLDTIIIDVEQAIAPTIQNINNTLTAVDLYDSYEWYIGTTLVSTNSTYDVTANGVTVRLVATTFSGCDVVNTHTVEGFGLNNFNNIGVSISPNPVKNTLLLSGDTEGIDDVRIVDLQGRTILKDFDLSKQIDVSELSTGLYMLIGIKDGNLLQTKFTKE